MKLLQNVLNNIAYYYYPKNMHESSSQYMHSIEHKNYLALHTQWKNLMVDLDPIIKDFKNNLKDSHLIVNGTTSNHPCYELEVLISSNECKTEVVLVYLSMFIPFFHIVLLERRTGSNEISFNFDVPEETETIITNIISENIKYQKFPNELLGYEIPNLKVHSDFNYLKAFFTDGYRIAHI